MKTLCENAPQRAHLARLVKLVSDKELTGTDAWSAFSAPKAIKNFYKKKVLWKTLNFTREEVKTYIDLRAAVQKYLFNKCSGSCAYCRRPVGHYGWAWHIEHVLPKSNYPSKTFELANLTVGCVHCNLWKGSRIDDTVVNGILPIINPSLPRFRYSDHLSYIQISTESLCFAKYFHLSPEGKETYKSLSFSELERAQAIDTLHAPSAALHERIDKAISAGLSKKEGQEVVNLLAQLKQHIYRIP